MTRAVKDTADLARVKARLGRPPGYEPLCGLDAAALTALVDPERPSLVGARRYLSGRSDMGIVRLARLLDALPEVDARAVVAEIARRLEERR